MKNFITEFKNKARNKDLTSADMFALCVFKAIKSKKENKLEILNYLIHKTFSPGKVCDHRYHPYQAVIQAHNSVRHRLCPGFQWVNGGLKRGNGFVLGVPKEEILSSDELEEFAKLVNGWHI